MSHAVTTDVITVSPATYARAAMSRLAERLWWVAVLPAVAFALAAFHDAAYLFAAFIWLLMLVPPAVMVAYYSYLLKPETAALSRPHRVTIDSHGVTVTFEAVDGDEHPLHADIYLTNNNLRTVIEKGDHLELDYTRQSPLPMLIIPYSAFAQGDAPHALANLYAEPTPKQ
ncbi:MAG: DUF4097 domain-containing protein [Muribaculaceae bacterium]|nr:DUF4097 domain-containing protein [Muribaculaceae bacterium]